MLQARGSQAGSRPVWSAAETAGAVIPPLRAGQGVWRTKSASATSTPLARASADAKQQVQLRHDAPQTPFARRMDLD